MAVWVTAGLSSTISCFNVYLDPVFEYNPFFYISYLSFYSLCLFVILLSYASIAIKIIRGNQPHHHGATNRERKLTKTLLIVTVASLLLTLPYIIFWILSSLSYTILTNSAWFLLSSFSILLLSANSLVNALLYTFRIPEFRRALFTLWRCGRQPKQAQVFPPNDL